MDIRNVILSFVYWGKKMVVSKHYRWKVEKRGTVGGSGEVLNFSKYSLISIVTQQGSGVEVWTR